MFPLRDDNPTLGTSRVTLGLIALNGLAWFGVQGFGGDPEFTRSICSFGAIPAAVLGSLAPGSEVALGPQSACTIGGSTLHTLFTSMFMHGGWFHILGNLWFLYVFGDNVEDAMGPVRFAVFYVLCGVAATAAHVASSPESAVPVVGASGAIGGVMGAYAFLYPKAPVHMLITLGLYITTYVVPAWVMLGYWFVIQLVGGLPALSGSGSGVAFWAHIGGFVVGVALLPLFRVPARVEAHRRRFGRPQT